MDPAFTQIKKGRVSDLVKSQIVNLITSGHLQVGDQLPTETTLANQFGVSRVPVREAVFSLEQSGLLTVKRGAGGGTFVSEPNLEPFGEFFTWMLRLGKASIQELTEARLTVEVGVAELAAKRASRQDLARLEESIKRYQDSLEVSEERNLADMDFHVLLAEASRNLVYNMIVRGLVSLMYRSVRDRKFTVKDRHKSIREHQQILEAVKAGDSRQASVTMSKHVRNMPTYWK